MVAERNTKLNQLQRSLPEGLVVDSAWLAAKGFSRALKDKYLRSGWLEAVAHGVYQRPLSNPLAGSGRLVEWERVVLSLQNLLDYPVSVGGRTALELQGFAHYLSASGTRTVHLYASARLPGWLQTLPTNAVWAVHNADRLFENGGRGLTSLSVHTETGERRSNDPIHGGFTTLPWGHWNWPLTVSTPERAALELVDELPARESFDQVDALISGLGTLSPRRLQRLLEICTSVKVKRLFLFLAERHNHAWLKQLDRNRIDLGTGKRSLVEHGRYDPKYQITVPDSLLKQGNGL
jgi:hypothetical protein